MSEHKKCPAVKLTFVQGKPQFAKCEVERPKGKPEHAGKHRAHGLEWE